MKWILRLVSGGDLRSSRLHTELNELISLREAALDLPRVLSTKIMATVRGSRPPVPWWPIRVLPIVDAFLGSQIDAIEFGSGSSSLWIAKRVRTLLSVEDDAEWGAKTKERLRALGLHNAQVRIGSGRDYWSAGSAGQFDFAVIDGSWRWRCLEEILPRMRPGGLVYFDNADSDKDRRFYTDSRQSRLAQRIMQDFASVTPKARLHKVRSLIHGEVYAGEGWLLWIP